MLMGDLAAHAISRAKNRELLLQLFRTGGRTAECLCGVGPTGFRLSRGRSFKKGAQLRPRLTTHDAVVLQSMGTLKFLDGILGLRTDFSIDRPLIEAGILQRVLDFACRTSACMLGLGMTRHLDGTCR